MCMGLTRWRFRVHGSDVGYKSGGIGACRLP